MSDPKKVDVAETLVEAADAIGEPLEFDAHGDRIARTVEDAADEDE